MKTFNMKYIFLSILSLFILALLIVSFSSGIHFNIGYILGEVTVLFWTWCIYLTFFTFLITLVWGVVRKIKNKSPKRYFITGIISLGISAILFVSLGITLVILENKMSSSDSEVSTKEKDVTEPPKNNFEQIESTESTSLPDDVQNFVYRYNKFKEISDSNGLDILPIKTDNITIDSITKDKQRHFVNLLPNESDLTLTTFQLDLNSKKTRIEQITFVGPVNDGVSALLGSAVSLGIEKNEELKKVLLEDLTEAVIKKEFYGKSLRINNHKIIVTYTATDSGLMFTISI